MDIQMLTQYFLQYGAFFIFLIVLLEYMNLPGFPAGVIMPLAGVWAAKGNINFFETMLLTLFAGLLGSWILYFMGRLGGDVFFSFIRKRFPKQQEIIEKNMEMLRKKGFMGIFVSKLIPMLRTVISIPAGIIKMNFWKYTVSSALGIFIWNLVLVGAGYLFGDSALKIFS